MTDEQWTAAKPVPVPYLRNRLKTDQNLIKTLREYAYESRSAMVNDLLYAAADRLEQLTRYLP